MAAHRQPVTYYTPLSSLVVTTQSRTGAASAVHGIGVIFGSYVQPDPSYWATSLMV